MLVAAGNTKAELRSFHNGLTIGIGWCSLVVFEFPWRMSGPCPHSFSRSINSPAKAAFRTSGKTLICLFHQLHQRREGTITEKFSMGRRSGSEIGDRKSDIGNRKSRRDEGFPPGRTRKFSSQRDFQLKLAHQWENSRAMPRQCQRKWWSRKAQSTWSRTRPDRDLAKNACITRGGWNGSWLSGAPAATPRRMARGMESRFGRRRCRWPAETQLGHKGHVLPLEGEVQPLRDGMFWGAFHTLNTSTQRANPYGESSEVGGRSPAGTKAASILDPIGFGKALPSLRD